MCVSGKEKLTLKDRNGSKDVTEFVFVKTVKLDIIHVWLGQFEKYFK